MEYTYNIATSPNLDGIQSDISISSMTDKSVIWCRWDEATQNLKVVFTNSLPVGDKDILDTIITNNS